MADTTQSRDQRILFDIIDKLRSQGLPQYVDLPEIIVCGDQSSGKSSVLEAISGMSFPTKDNLCTRFATELILRRTADKTPCAVSIIPDSKRPEKEQNELRSFDRSIEPGDLNLGDVVEDAKDKMGLSDSKIFSKDILRIELGGPEQPHLTMVDLPGLFVAGNKNQTEEDARTVRRMVRNHMKRPRSIILAVVSAKTDFANQQVTTLTKEVDPQGVRTIGLITKPDLLHEGSESESAYLNLARNQDVEFQLGWHVVRNRDYPERNSSTEERNAVEDSLFSKLPWSTLDRKQLGVVNLKPRLSGILMDQILIRLPSLLADVEKGIKDCSDRLQKLGKSRGTSLDQRRYLFAVSDGFTRLVDKAARGDYSDAFFGDAMTDEGEAKRLRAVVQNRFVQFATQMRKHGRTRNIIDTEDDVDSWSAISRKEYIEEVNDRMRRSRGSELPGTFNPLIIRDLFTQQCTKWKSFAFQCQRDILNATQDLIADILDEVAAPETRDVIYSKIMSGLESIAVEIKAKTNEVLLNHTNGHPITYNHYLTDEVQKVQSDRRRKKLEKFLDEYFVDKLEGNRNYYCNPRDIFAMVADHVEANMDNYASSLAVDYSEAYFKVASKRFIDDFADLSIERCLMSKIANLFSRDMIDELDEDEIFELARESPDAAESRARYMAKLEVLLAGFEDLKKLSRHRTGRFRRNAHPDGVLQNGHLTSSSDTESEAESERTEHSARSERSLADATEHGKNVEPARHEKELTFKERKRLKKGLRRSNLIAEE